MCSITGQRQAQSVSPGCTGVVCKPDSATCLASCPQELLLIRDQVCVSIVCEMVVASFVCWSPSRAFHLSRRIVTIRWGTSKSKNEYTARQCAHHSHAESRARSPPVSELPPL